MNAEASHFSACFYHVDFGYMLCESATAMSSLGELAQVLRTYTDARKETSPFATEIKGFTILRSDREKPPSHRIFKPALCITVQGAKWATFGSRRYDYRAGQALVVSVEMPSRGTVSAASPSEPFLGIVIEFNLPILHEVAEQFQAQSESIDTDKPSGVFVIDLNTQLIDCALRSVRLLETPEAIPFLYPGIMREICYWVLTGPGGKHIFRALTSTSNEERLIAAIHALKDRFAQPVAIEKLAEIARMSPATFHRQFKSVTSLTPLQYQKQLRLLEARRLMLSSSANVEAAAFQVGYESSSQFSREYTRKFGRSPRRDVSALRAPDLGS